MPKIIRTLFFLAFLLCACSAGGLSPEAPISPPATDTPALTVTTVSTTESVTDILPVLTTEVPPLPKLIATLSTPHIDQGPDGANTIVPSNPQDCGYQWAQQALLELSNDFQGSIQKLQTDAQAYAFAFGENCTHSDGTVTFLPMETDFNITLQAADLSNGSDLGEWIVKVMKVIENIPSDQIAGPRPGRVTIGFHSGGDQKVVSFYIDQYHALATDLSSAEIYLALQAPP